MQRRILIIIIIVKIIFLTILFLLFYFVFDIKVAVKYSTSEDASLHVKEIKEIHIYKLDRNMIYMLSYNRKELFSEEEMRSIGNMHVFYNDTGRSYQAEYIALLLYYAKPINIDPKKNIPKKHKGYLDMDSGCVIDLIDYNGEIIRTYIMQNGLDVFYIKGEESIYYRMPKPIIDNFYIDKMEFIKNYKRLTRIVN